VIGAFDLKKLIFHICDSLKHFLMFSDLKKEVLASLDKM